MYTVQQCEIILGLNFLFRFVNIQQTTINYQIANKNKSRRNNMKKKTSGVSTLQIQIQIQVPMMLCNDKYIKLRKVVDGYRTNIFPFRAVK